MSSLEDNQFYARDDANEGTLFYTGTVTDAADSVFLKVYADDKPYETKSAPLNGDRTYSFAVKLKPGLITYKTEFGTKTGERETIRHRANNLVCGDAYIITGQSNAVSTDWGREEPPAFHSEWIRTFGSMSGNPAGVKLWGEATYRNHDAGEIADR